MNKRHWLAALLILLVLSVGAWTQVSKQQWEYKVVFSPVEKKINELASQGWELVTVDTYQNYVFKRSKP